MASSLMFPLFPSHSFQPNRRNPISISRSSSPATYRIIAQASTRISNADDLNHRDYYEILGVNVDASYEEIRKAYRNLQKIHHPDVAGPEGHAMTLLLNEAYKTLTSNELRRAYSSSNPNTRGTSEYSYTGFSYSAWNGPDRPQGIFVDENACIGCRECVFHARKTFSMDESSGCARVTNQWGDSDAQIKVALQACPVNCIHYVEREDLPVLEYLMRPQPKESNGVFGGGWERPSNVFMAARTFKRKMEATSNLNSKVNEREETPAQRKARMDADFKMRAGAFSWLWSWGFNQPGSTNAKKSSNKDSTSWYGLFGRSSTSELLKLEIESNEASKVIQSAQEWAITFASSSELPLPLPFKADPLPNGVHLTLIAADMGVLQAKGSLVVTIENDEDGTTFLVVKREGVTGTSALPGERTIIRHLKEAVQGHDKSYDSYRVPQGSS